MARVDAISNAPPARPSVWGQTLGSPTYLVWCLFLLLAPVYVFGNGLPQPSDLLVVPLFAMVFIGWNRRMHRSYATIFRSLIWFTVWVIVVNYGWATILGKWGKLKDFIIHPFFYLFNAGVLYVAFQLATRDSKRFLRITTDVIFVSVAIQVAASFVYRTDLYRGTVFFNSPNQLGYYALLAACLFAMTQRPLGFSRLRSSIGVTLCAYLALLSASRAALAGIAVLLFVLVFSNPRTIILASIAAVGLLMIGGPVEKALETYEHRVTHVNNPKVTFAEERGYDRIWENPEYLLTGAGEGAYDRFAAPGEHGRELHSSFGSILFGYGFIGVALFVVFFFRVVRGASLRTSAMLVPAFVYTVAHQGLRFTIFWVVLAVFVVLKQLPADPRRT